MRGLRGQRGQATVEYAGVLIVAMLLLAAIMASGIAARLVGAVDQSICRVLPEQGCASSPGGAPPGSVPPAVDPQLTPSQRAALLGPPAGAQRVLDTLDPAERRWLQQNDSEAARAVERATAWRQDRQVVDRFSAASLDEFLAYRSSKNPDPSLDWSTDECSAPVVGNTGLSFDFTNACIRHDFGYRNYRRLGIFPQNKAKVDSQFLADMKAHCATRTIFLQGSCYRWAYTYYRAVREFG